MLQRRRAGRIRPQLDGLRAVLATLGDPQRRFPSILVVGTNGKGSTVAMLEAMLRAHGLTTGLYTSPHLVRVEERIRLDGRPISGAELEDRLADLEAFPELTYFEALTAVAFTVFADAEMDVAVLEAGMGGSWDATRLAGSAIAGLTNVGSDHGAWLGSQRQEIARDKGQALEAAERAVYGAGVPADILTELGAPAASAADSMVRVAGDGAGRIRLAWEDAEVAIRLPLAGSHQVENLQLAVALALEAVDQGLLAGLESTRVREALEGLEWPGRLSVHRVAGRSVLVDCAHNLEAARSLAGYLDGVDRRYNLLFSCLDDKPVEAMAEILEPFVGKIAVCPLADERTLPLEQLAAAFPNAVQADSPLEGLKLLSDPVLAAGSVRLVGELLAHAEETLAS